MSTDRTGLPESLKLHPNPVADQLIINDAAGGAYTITNLLGQRILSGTLGSGEQSINTASMPAGTYLLQLRDKNGGRSAAPFVKQ